MRRFYLVRKEDVSGVSGTGAVAEGIEFSNGKAVITWLSKYSSVAVYDSIGMLENVHGHGGSTTIEYIDPPYNQPTNYC